MHINRRTARRRFGFAVLILLAVSLRARTTSAQDSWPSVVVRGGGLIADFGSDVRLDGSAGNFGTSVDLEDDLGFSSKSNTWFADAVWRMTRKSQLQIDYEGARRDVSKSVISKPITVGDTTFTASAQVDAFLDTFYLSGYYGYAFVATPAVELGASIGLTVVRLHTGIGLAAQASGGTTVSRQLTENEKLTVPVPLPGVFFNVRPHPRVTVDASTRWIKATIGDYTASMIEARAGVDVTIAKPIGVGAAYYYNKVDIERNATVIDGRIVYAFNGPQIYATLSF